jgi:hypothetical protein
MKRVREKATDRMMVKNEKTDIKTEAKFYEHNNCE